MGECPLSLLKDMLLLHIQQFQFPTFRQELSLLLKMFEVLMCSWYSSTIQFESLLSLKSNSIKILQFFFLESVELGLGFISRSEHSPYSSCSSYSFYGYLYGYYTRHCLSTEPVLSVMPPQEGPTVMLQDGMISTILDEVLRVLAQTKNAGPVSQTQWNENLYLAVSRSVAQVFGKTSAVITIVEEVHRIASVGSTTSLHPIELKTQSKGKAKVKDRERHPLSSSSGSTHY